MITKYSTKLTFPERHVELVKEHTYRYSSSDYTNSEKIGDMMCDLFKIHECPEEKVYLIAMGKNNIKGVFEISQGIADASLIRPREIFQRLLLANATEFILVHNHPTGSLKPSNADLETTKRIKELGVMMGLLLLDHIIIGNVCNYFSFAYSGIL